MTPPTTQVLDTALADTVPFELTRPADLSRDPAPPPPDRHAPSVPAPAASHAVAGREVPDLALPPAAAPAPRARPDALAQATLRRVADTARAARPAAAGGMSAASTTTTSTTAAKPATAAGASSTASAARVASAPTAPAATAATAAPAAPATLAGATAPATQAPPVRLQVQQPAVRRAPAPATAGLAAQPVPVPRAAQPAAAATAAPAASPSPVRSAVRPAPAAPVALAKPAAPARASAVPSPAGARAGLAGQPAAAGQTLQTAEDTGWVQAALRLLQFEQEIRGLPDLTALQMHICNDAQAVLGFDQAIVWRRHRGTGRLRPVMASGLPTVDREAPAMRALTRVLRRLQRGRQLEGALKLDLHNRDRLPRLRPADRQALAGLSLRHGLWYPMPDRDGSYHAGVLFLHHQPFPAGAPRLMGRLAATYAHAWRALGSASTLAEGRRWPWLAAALCLPLLVGGALVPVRLSVMAPVEVVAAAPHVVTAPISGVVRQILVSPSAPVSAGMPLLQFDDIQPRNEMLLAQQRLAVAQARDARTAAAAFTDPAAAHELATAQAELQLARVAYDYAVEVLKRTQVVASHAGVAIYSDRRDWEGRAVQVGEEILQVADPSQVAFKVALSAGNSIPLTPGTDVDIYLADAPLGGLPATLRTVSYTPQPQPGGEASYVVMADAAGPVLPRIGARGTARLYGDTVPLGVQLMRRPLAALRQWAGL